MTDNQMFGLVAAIIGGAWLIGHSIERGLKSVAERLSANRDQLEKLTSQLERTGTKLDAIWGPLKSINNALWVGKPDPDLD